MNSTVRTILISAAVLFAALLLIGIGVVVGRFAFGASGPALNTWGPWSMMQPVPEEGYAYPLMPHGRWGMRGPGNFRSQTEMPCGAYGNTGNCPRGGPGAPLAEQVNGEPLSIGEARSALNNFLKDYGDEDLVIGEIMIFSNHAYAGIVEESTGMGAMEVLVDPESLNVYPEYGPNMMWNLKYGHMAGFRGGRGMMGRGMMGGWNQSELPETAEDMPVSEEQAVDIAQQYLDTYYSGLEAGEHADPFYGYYTIHVEENGNVVGMLSVNGYTNQVFYHTWHGEFIEMTEDHEE